MSKTTANDTTATTTTEAPKARECVTEATENRIVENMRSLHHIILLGLQEVGIKPLFNDKFADCSNEDYKNLHHQARTILSQAAKVRWDSYSKGIAAKIQGVVDAHMVKARAAKARIDAMLAQCEDESERAMVPAFPNNIKVGLPALISCFPEGKSDTHIIAELNKLFPGQVGTKAAKNAKDTKREDVYVTFAFKPAEEPKVAPAPTSEDKVEEGPKSGEQVTDKAAE
jgi:hypothetical protein